MSKSTKKKPLATPKPQASAPKASAPTALTSLVARWPFLLLGFTALVMLQARLRMLSIPMERDEGGFAYIGYHLWHGKSLYIDMADNKLPGLYALYGMFVHLFGYSATGVHIGLLLCNAAAAVCLFYLLRDIYDEFVACVSTAIFLLVSFSANVFGFAAHATQLLLPFALGGWLCYWRGIRSGRLSLFFAAGLLLGFAVTVKQQSAIFGLMAAVLWWPFRLLWYKKEQEKLPILEWIALGVGGLAPAAMIIGYFYSQGRFDDLYFWAYKQPTNLSAAFQESTFDMVKKRMPRITNGIEIIWIAAALGIAAIFRSGFQKGAAWFGLLLAVLGIGSVVIGAAFYPHYFVLGLPGLALLAACALYWAYRKINPGVANIMATVLILWPMAQMASYLIRPNFDLIHQKTYTKNMFPELEQIGWELNKRTRPDEKIGILGSEPEVLVAARRESCSKHLYMYPLLHDRDRGIAMQNEYLQELDQCKPNYVVWNTVSGSWSSKYGQLSIYKNFTEWLAQYYDQVGIAEFRDKKPGLILWDEAAQTHSSETAPAVRVYKRKGGQGQ